MTEVKRKLGKKFATASPSVLRKTMQQVLRAELKRRSGQPQRKRRNLSGNAADKYEAFQGKPATTATPLNFPDGTPGGLYKLGKLHLIKLADGREITVARQTAWLCADARGKLHLGTTAERLTDAPRGELGEVKQIEYVTAKPHLGEPDKTIFFHRMGEETGKRPTLFADGKGGLVFKGGAYTVTPEGIRN